MKISLAKTEKEVSDCFSLIAELRPHLTRDEFIRKVSDMSKFSGYELIMLNDCGVKAVAGVRISEWLHTGKYLEIEELITSQTARSKGYGSKLFDWICNYAKQKECRQVRLVSGVSRADAHRFYVDKGMTFEAKYFSLTLE